MAGGFFLDEAAECGLGWGNGREGDANQVLGVLMDTLAEQL